MFALSGMAIPLQAVLLAGCVWAGRAGVAQGLHVLKFFFEYQLNSSVPQVHADR